MFIAYIVLCLVIIPLGEGSTASATFVPPS